MGEQRRAPLAPHVQHTVTDRDVDETWQRLDASLRPERRALRWWVLAGVAAAALVTAVVMVRRTPSQPVLEAGTPLVASATEVTGRLSEGSTVFIEPDSNGGVDVVSASEVRVRLERGVMRFDVAKNPSRRFSVVAGRVEVRVIGTRFVVRHDVQTRVEVERGTVEVWRHGERSAVLSAGASWSEEAQVVDTGHDEPEPEPESDALDDSEPERADAVVKPARRKPVKRVVEQKTEPLPVVPTTIPAEEDPAVFFKVALEARRAGRAGEAAQGLRAFLAKFPDDSRAGLALFELGRLQMDQLGASSSAVESLERSLSKSSSSSYAEDAMARLVRLHHQLKHEQACSTAKSAYVKRFPAGLHTATLDALCTF